MLHVLEAAISWPTVIWTVLLGLVVVFWLVVLLAGLDFDFLHLHFDADLDLDLDGHVGLAEAFGGKLGAVLGFLNVGVVPVTFIVSVVVLQGWMANMILALTIQPLVGELLHWSIWGIMTFTLTTALALLCSRWVTRPCRGFFEVHTFEGGAHLVDQICLIRTTAVNDRMGEADFQRNGAPILLSVRCRQENELKRGDEAVIVSYDEQTKLYEVAPLDPKRPSRREAPVPAGG